MPAVAVITVVGAGMMGSALCVPLTDAGHEVRLVGTHLDEEIIASLKASGVHPKMGLELPKAITPHAIADIAAAMEGVEIIGVGVSSAGVDWCSRTLAPFVRPDVPIVMITKGLSWDGSGLRVLPDVLLDHFPEALRAKLAPAVVAGPCIAGELARRVESAVVLTGRDPDVLMRLSSLMRTPYYFPFVDPDIVGVEACAALKNAYAMGIAFATGLHEARGGKHGSVAMHNSESAIFAQAACETRRIVELMGGSGDSVLGLAGVGDLDVTTNGGRTGRFGKWLGTGLSREQAIEKMEGATLECLEILEQLRKALASWEKAGRLARGELPLLRHMQAVALDGAAVAPPYAEFFSGLPAPGTGQR